MAEGKIVCDACHAGDCAHCESPLRCECECNEEMED